jgi:acetyl-CoA C-acetyltransferase
VSPRDPVLVGIGEVANKDDDRIVHPVELLESAARLAFEDAGMTSFDAVGAVFSTPLSVFSEEHGGAMVAERLGLPPGVREQSRYSGAGSQGQLARACAGILDGSLDAALLVGGIADASVRRARLRGEPPPAPPTSVWSQGSDGTEGIDDLSESMRRRGFRFTPEEGAGAGMPSSYFALVESVIGNDRLGDLMAPFTRMAASRPDLAWFPIERTPDEIAVPSASNRMVAEPYTKLMCSFPTVDLAGALVVVSTELADRLGVPASKRVTPLAIALGKEAGSPAERRRPDRSLALGGAVERALAAAGVDVGGIGAFDLYSCFPAAVQLALAAFGVDVDDPRPFTLTGGLPYFGGPGASYTVHGMAAAVARVRSAGEVVGVVGVGGMVDDFSVGVYAPEGSTVVEVEPTVHEIEVPVVQSADGAGRVVASTVLHERSGPVAVPVIAELEDGTRIGVRAADGVAPVRPPVGTEVRLAGGTWLPG